MKHLKQFLLMAMLLFTLAPLQVSAKENIDVKEILWGHIKDSYFCLLIICFRTAYERRFFFSTRAK